MSWRELAIMRIVVTGASGQLGSYLIDRLIRDGASRCSPGVAEDGERTRAEAPPGRSDRRGRGRTRRSRTSDPEAVIHAGGHEPAGKRSGRIRRGPGRQRRGDASTGRLVRGRGRRLVFTSTDLVFDGTSSWYREDDPARPIMAYGRTKPEAETSVLAAPRRPRGTPQLAVRADGADRAASLFFDRAIAALRAGRDRSRFFEDEFRTPLDLTARPRRPRSPGSTASAPRASSTSAGGSGSAGTS